MEGANIMGTNDSAAAAVDDDYVVKLPSGDARVMSIDELDAALEAGTIHKDSPVLAPGTVTWTTLGVLAGLDDEPAHSAVVAVAAIPSPSSIAPMVMSGSSGADVEVPLSLDSLDDDSAILRPRRRLGKVVVAAFGALAIFAVGFAIKSAVSQTLATRAAEAALAAQPASPLPATPPPPAAPSPPPVVEAAPAPPAPAPAAAAASAPHTTKATATTAKDKDSKKKGKLPGAPSSAPKKK